MDLIEFLKYYQNQPVILNRFPFSEKQLMLKNKQQMFVNLLSNLQLPVFKCFEHKCYIYYTTTSFLTNTQKGSLETLFRQQYFLFSAKDTNIFQVLIHFGPNSSSGSGWKNFGSSKLMFYN